MRRYVWGDMYDDTCMRRYVWGDLYDVFYVLHTSIIISMCAAKVSTGWCLPRCSMCIMYHILVCIMYYMYCMYYITYYILLYITYYILLYGMYYDMCYVICCVWCILCSENNTCVCVVYDVFYVMKMIIISIGSAEKAIDE